MLRGARARTFLIHFAPVNQQRIVKPKLAAFAFRSLVLPSFSSAPSTSMIDQLAVFGFAGQRRLQTQLADTSSADRGHGCDTDDRAKRHTTANEDRRLFVAAPRRTGAFLAVQLSYHVPRLRRCSFTLWVPAALGQLPAHNALQNVGADFHTEHVVRQIDGASALVFES